MRKLGAGVVSNIAGLVVGAILAGSVAYSGQPVPPGVRQQLRPVAEQSLWTFLHGTRLRVLGLSDQALYVAGVIDGIAAVVSEMAAMDQAVPLGVEPERWATLSEHERSLMRDVALRLKLAALFMQAEGVSLPPTATALQIADVVRRYLDAHPEQLHYPAALLVWRAVAEAEW